MMIHACIRRYRARSAKRKPAVGRIEVLQNAALQVGTAAGLALLLAFSPPALAGPGATKPGVLRSFDGKPHGDGSSGGHAFPADIRRGLNIDERTLSCFTDAQGAVLFEDKWFAGARIDLDGDGRLDWVVHSLHPCLGGDSAARWWIFRALPQGEHRLTLTANASSLDILKQKVNGFRVIRGDGARYRYSTTHAEYALER